MDGAALVVVGDGGPALAGFVDDAGDGIGPAGVFVDVGLRRAVRVGDGCQSAGGVVGVVHRGAGQGGRGNAVLRVVGEGELAAEVVDDLLEEAVGVGVGGGPAVAVADREDAAVDGMESPDTVVCCPRVGELVERFLHRVQAADRGPQAGARHFREVADPTVAELDDHSFPQEGDVVRVAVAPRFSQRGEREMVPAAQVVARQRERLRAVVLQVGVTENLRPGGQGDGGGAVCNWAAADWATLLGVLVLQDGLWRRLGGRAGPGSSAIAPVEVIALVIRILRTEEAAEVRI